MIKAGEELLRLQEENKNLGAKVYALSSNLISLEQDKIDLLEENKKLKDSIDEAIEEIEQTLYVDSLIFGELIDFKNGKITADDVIEEFNKVTRNEVLEILKRNIGVQNDGPINRESETVSN